MDTRRSFALGLVGFVACAPAIVRAASLMAIKPLPAPVTANYLVDLVGSIKFRGGLYGIERGYWMLNGASEPKRGDTVFVGGNSYTVQDVYAEGNTVNGITEVDLLP